MLSESDLYHFYSDFTIIEVKWTKGARNNYWAVILWATCPKMSWSFTVKLRTKKWIYALKHWKAIPNARSIFKSPVWYLLTYTLLSSRQKSSGEQLAVCHSYWKQSSKVTTRGPSFLSAKCKVLIINIFEECRTIK